MNSARFLQTIRFYEAGPRSQQQPLVGAAVRVLWTAGSDHTATGRRATATARKYHTATGQLSGVGGAPLPLGAVDFARLFRHRTEQLLAFLVGGPQRQGPFLQPDFVLQEAGKEFRLS
uniref:Uncharacterized protein n=1 Tax=Anopheles melas TaxID=34690 RepID=A0A182UKB0_9DIPT